MSAVVIEFRKRPAKPVEAQFPTTPYFYCRSCDSNEFRIYGCAVYCANCRAVIRNLFATKL